MDLKQLRRIVRRADQAPRAARQEDKRDGEGRGYDESYLRAPSRVIGKAGRHGNAGCPMAGDHRACPVGGPRMPSELTRLRWSDVDFENAAAAGTGIALTTPAEKLAHKMVQFRVVSMDGREPPTRQNPAETQ